MRTSLLVVLDYTGMGYTISRRSSKQLSECFVLWTSYIAIMMNDSYVVWQSCLLGALDKK